MTTPTVTVIIPTYNDTARLALCLDALSQQTYPQAKFEVWVVDNNSSQPCDKLVSQYAFARYLHEAHPGSYSARNLALKQEGLGEIIAFTDSDCIPDKEWLSAAIKALENAPEKLGAIGGRIDMYAASDSPSLAELYDMVTGFDQADYIRKENFSVTANLVTRLSVIEAVGEFNANLKSSGDKDWCQRMVKAGFSLVYCDSAKVKHPARQSVSSIKTKLRRLYGGFYYNHLNVKADKLFSFLGLVEAMMPPIDKIRQLRKTKLSISVARKFQLVAFFYYLKFYTLTYRLKLLSGFEKNVERL
jgi:cellulose synthase/poly-beta-1,6-N-acetylglucosamine synthase-like glycosyltransferase